MNNVIFTICAKNYLAQALSLRESVLKHNSVDFRIFLADDAGGLDIPDLVGLDDAWIPGWRSMAFKYDVVEFNTSIKPFCIRKLFDDGYDKVVYLDPDIFVVRPLDYVFDNLDRYSVILTPHRCEMLQDYEGAISEETCLHVGIYNLGFVALRNDAIGRRLADWWCRRLADKCYIEMNEALFVDQKWMNFIPGFFPEQVLISRHLGLNTALWNLQEREVLYEDGSYKVRSRCDADHTDPLVFFHFSGYSPHVPDRIDKRDESLTVQSNPEFKALVSAYCECELRNGYERYSTMQYSFNVFNNGEVILPLHRRLYRCHEQEFQGVDNPFDASAAVYARLQSNRLILHAQPAAAVDTRTADVRQREEVKLHRWLRLFLKVAGVRRYALLMRACHKVSIFENHSFLLDE